MELTQEEKMMLAAKQQLLLYRTLHEPRPRCKKCVYELQCLKIKIMIEIVQIINAMLLMADIMVEPRLKILFDFYKK